MPRPLAAASATAIAAIYLAGYLRTQAADAQIGAAADATSPSIVQTTANATPMIAVASQPALTFSVTPTAVRPAVNSPAATYRDGTYTGQGASRRGDVWVSVDVQGGQIASVTITRSTLQYPVRDIAGLPAQVVQRQSAQVDTVSRATYSSQAFRAAVTQALGQAR